MRPDALAGDGPGRRHALTLLWGSAALLLAGCATPRRPVQATGTIRDFWSGRLALRIDSPRPQSLAAGFELQGDAQEGRLSLFNPLGGTVARMAWAPGQASLQADGQERRFDSLGALTSEVTGAELPIASLFQWLAGSSATAEGWQAELEGLSNGRLVARRSQPSPAIELRLVIDP